MDTILLIRPDLFWHMVFGFGLTSFFHCMPKRTWVFIVLGCLAIPVWIEAVQAYMPNRECDILDVIFSYAGTAVGFLFLPYRK